MSERVHLLAQSIFGKSTLEECTLQETRDLAQRYPYFAPAQFLYLQKLKSANHDDYLKQLQKAVLYYHNPLAFEYFISSDRFQTEVKPEKENTVIKDVQPVSQPMKNEFENTAIGEIAQTGSENVQHIVEEKVLAEEPNPPVTERPVMEADEEKAPIIVPPAKNEEANELQTSNPKPETLSFEPFHTVDYFASQGIKLSQEEVPKDKFGKQLKSFTDWLKTMKRLPGNQVSQLDTSSEKKVTHLAEDSVHNSDVITEAMAEVWLKQGNPEKAIETYNKLSLLNPSKRAYFATLIENLKRS